jgi:hypothetical protein
MSCLLAIAAAAAAGRKLFTLNVLLLLPTVVAVAIHSSSSSSSSSSITFLEQLHFWIRLLVGVLLLLLITVNQQVWAALNEICHLLQDQGCSQPLPLLSKLGIRHTAALLP